MFLLTIELLVNTQISYLIIAIVQSFDEVDKSGVQLFWYRNIWTYLMQ